MEETKLERLQSTQGTDGGGAATEGGGPRRRGPPRRKAGSSALNCVQTPAGSEQEA